MEDTPVERIVELFHFTPKIIRRSYRYHTQIYHFFRRKGNTIRERGTKEVCLDALKRFRGRCGNLQSIYSDNSTPFIEAWGEFKFRRLLWDEESKISSTILRAKITLKGLQYHTRHHILEHHGQPPLNLLSAFFTEQLDRLSCPPVLSKLFWPKLRPSSTLAP